MTRDEFEAARRKSAQKYKADAESELRSLKAPIAVANAKRRIALINRCEEQWRKVGFWTPETDYSYRTLYEHLPADASVSPF